MEDYLFGHGFFRPMRQIDPVFACLLLGAIHALIATLYWLFSGSRTKHGIPIVGYRSILEPTWLVRLRFIRGSRKLLREGYEKYRDLFVIRRWTNDVVVIGDQKYLEEIRSKTKDSVRSVEPFLVDLAGDFFDQGKVFMESDLQNRVLQHKLTPNLGNLVPIMKSELAFALEQELPDIEAKDWVEADIVRVFARTVARVVARVWIGPEECRNESWLVATTDYTENVFTTGFILRFVPRFVRPFLAPCLPTYRNLMKSIGDAHRIVGGLAAKRTPATVGDKSAGTAKPNDVLQWTMDMASDRELELDNLAERIQVLSLSAIHTTALTMTQTLYDLVAHPEHINTLRAEFLEVLRAEGGWDKNTVHRFSKLDSALKESQRFNPVFLMTFNRYLPTDITLSNGVHLPARTRIAVPQHAIANDAAHVPGGDPATYDPWRYSRLREESGNAQKSLFTMADPTHMAFGYGKYACPGRFFVANEVKMILAHLLLRYEWRFPAGCGRPESFTIDGDMYPDPTARIAMRRRQVDKDVEELIGF